MDSDVAGESPLSTVNGQGGSGHTEEHTAAVSEMPTQPGATIADLSAAAETAKTVAAAVAARAGTGVTSTLEPLGTDATDLRRDSRSSGDPDLASSTAWYVTGQMIPVLVTVFLTPYVIHGLGVVRWGMFLITSTLATFLSTFDGGIMATARRYFGVYAGSDDVKSATRLLATLLAIIAGFGVILSSIGWVVAPSIVSLLHIKAGIRPESVFLVRTLGVLVTFSFFHNLFVGLLMAHHRFAYITKMGFLVYALWAVGLALTVREHWGLRGIAIVFVAQQIFLALVIVPVSLKYVSRRHVGFLGRSDVRELLSYSVRLQVSSISVLVNTEVDTLIVGGALSVRTVAFFNAGTNFAQQTTTVGYNAGAPAVTALANAYGREGAQGAFAELCRLQKIWVVGVTGWFAAAAGAAWFAVVAWLGPQFSIGGTVAIIALISQMFPMYTVLLRGYCEALGRPGLETRFGVLAMVSNLVLTAPLVLLGPVGVISATAAGQLLGTIYFVRLVRTKVSRNVPNPLRFVPVVPAVVMAFAVVGMELSLKPILPQGGFGLLACGLPAFVGLALYMVVLFGPRQLAQLARAALARRRGDDVPWPSVRVRLASGS